ncbi:LLM class F420-dependent oxidoreductase [Candidatus Oscillochloris fontis]|uniref:LLM class F420-dependent oxidoreductase n=1 Tax=Candidatus Oscillochloris fontis TaxID=2496868 RepID=UPI00101DFF7C|nr:LLM class F420-dependent oxidoreductase [Candidatus Oscillochloris fontis]
MKIGLQIPSFTWPGGDAAIGQHLAEIGQRADEAGFASLWVMDHFFQIQFAGPAEDPMLEGYSALSFLAAVTRRVTLGTLVTGVIYRYPGILAKTVSTLDVLSGGRAWLGIGAGWYEREAKGLGTPYPPLKERFEQLEEALQIVLQMWAGTVAPFEGKHFHLAETLNQPQPVRKPRPPIMVGGTGEQKTLRMVAQYADACNLFDRMGADTIRHKLDVLKRHCEQLGRPYEEIEVTTLGTAHIAPGAQSADDIITHCKSLAALGVHHAIFNMPNVSELAPLTVFKEQIIPAVADL